LAEYGFGEPTGGTFDPASFVEELMHMKWLLPAIGPLGPADEFPDFRGSSGEEGGFIGKIISGALSPSGQTTGSEDRFVFPPVAQERASSAPGVDPSAASIQPRDRPQTTQPRQERPAAKGGAPVTLKIHANTEVRGAPMQAGAQTVRFYPEKTEDGRTVEVIQYENKDGSVGWLRLPPTAAGEHLRIGPARG